MKKPGKRIVSKGEYAKVQATRAGDGIIGCVFGCIGLFCALFTIASGFGFVGSLLTGDFTFAYFWLMGSIVMGSGVYFLYSRSSSLLEKAVNTDPGIPLTQDNIRDLPAPESLVRASAEPVQVPQSVLLRATTNSEQTPVEQLVRPASGRSE